MDTFINIKAKNVRTVQRALQFNFSAKVKAPLRESAEALRQELATPPGPVKHPLVFASAKQAKWFWKVYIPRRRAAGLGPWQRETDPESSQLLRSWKISVKGLVATVTNAVKYAAYVQGTSLAGWIPSGAPRPTSSKLGWQQPFHANTGWQTDQGAIDKLMNSGTLLGIWNRWVIGLLSSRLGFNRVGRKL